MIQGPRMVTRQRRSQGPKESRIAHWSATPTIQRRILAQTPYPTFRHKCNSNPCLMAPLFVFDARLSILPPLVSRLQRKEARIERWPAGIGRNSNEPPVQALSAGEQPMRG